MKIAGFIAGTMICGGIALLIFALLQSRAVTTELNQESQFCYLENSDSVELIGIMAEPKVFISRSSETSDAVNLQFNEESSRLLGKKPLNFEETAEGILITVPQVDIHKAKKITYKKRIIPFYIKEEFNEEWFNVTTIDEGTFLIPIDFE